MAFDFRSARFWAEEMLRQCIEPGARVIDATMGNGKDTLWLAGLVGETGKVYAFDVQKDAVERSRARLEEAGLLDRVRLIHDGHERVLSHVQEPVDAAVFNLGWLPGGDKRFTTRVDTTLQALKGCLELLKPGGLMTICAYPGHEEGELERRAIREWAAALDSARYDALTKAYLNQPNKPPQLFAIKRVK